MIGNLFYASAAGAASGNSMTGGEYGKDLGLIAHPISVSMSENVDLLRSNLQDSSYYYSRNRAFTILNFILRELILIMLHYHLSTTTVTPLNISFNSKHLWWDYTYTGTSYHICHIYSSSSKVVGEYPINYSTYNQTYGHASSQYT